MYIGVKIPEHHLHHVTLAFLGKSEFDTLDQYQRAAAATSAATVPFPYREIRLDFGSTEKFDEGPWYAPVWSLELVKFRDTLVECMQYYGVDFAQEYEFTPHVTLSYWPKEPTNPYAGTFVEVNKITLFSNKFGQTDFWI